MAKCPKCKKEIKTLRYESKRIEVGDFDLKNAYDSDDYPHDGGLSFKCPSCGELLFNTGSNAYNFLKEGETK